MEAQAPVGRRPKDRSRRPDPVRRGADATFAGRMPQPRSSTGRFVLAVGHGPANRTRAVVHSPARGAVPSSPNLVVTTPTVASIEMNRFATFPLWNWSARPGLNIP